MPAKRKAKRKPKPASETRPPCPTLGIDDTIAQERSNWCWAACIDVVVRFRSNPGLRQCDVATSALPGQACCGVAAGALSPCDVAQTTAQITSLFTISGIQAQEDAPLSARVLTAELNANRLVGVHITWNGGGGHMLIVYGCVGNKFRVYDPLFSQSQAITIGDLRNYMDGDGTWDLSWRNL